VRKLVFDAGLVPALVRLLRAHDFQVVHAVEEAVFPAIVLARRWRIPVVYDMQSHLPESMRKSVWCRVPPVTAILELLQRWAVRNADAVACSAGLEEYVGRVREIGPIHPWRYPSFEVRTTSEDIGRLRGALGIDSDRPVILYTGNFEPYQGLARLVEAAPHVLDEIPGAYFLFVGGGDAGELAALPGAERLVRAGALRCLPRQPRPSIPGFLALADVVVSPREAVANLPLKVFDYMAAGKAIVATDSPSHRAYLTENRALLVAPDGRAVARGIVRLLRDRDEAERLGERARAYAVEHLGWLGFRGHLAAFYEATLANASLHGRR